MSKLKYVLALSALVLGQSLWAADVVSDADLINMAGRQRMLSQRIAKAYLFLGSGVRADKAREQLSQSISTFNKSHDTLVSNVKNADAQQMLLYIGATKDDFVKTSAAAFTKESAKKVLDDSEAILEGSQKIVDNLEESSKIKQNHLVNLAGRQRMLSQRIAKYYMAYQAGFQDPDVVKQLNDAVNNYEAAHAELVANRSNTAEINAELARINSLWVIVRNYFKEVQKGGLPVIVFTTTDNITEGMDKVTRLYAEQIGSPVAQM